MQKTCGVLFSGNLNARLREKELVFKRAKLIDDAVQLAIEAIGGEFKQILQRVTDQQSE